jgi:histidine triad (HIT) family protein
VIVEGCLFCGIVAGDVDADVVHVTERTVAFRDLNAQAPTHVLVVPRDHYANAAELAAGDPEASSELVTTAAAVATAEGHEDYRLVFNTGAGAGQSVFHTHLHLLAGRPFTWPPG